MLKDELTDAKAAGDMGRIKEIRCETLDGGGGDERILLVIWDTINNQWVGHNRWFWSIQPEYIWYFFYSIEVKKMRYLI